MIKWLKKFWQIWKDMDEAIEIMELPKHYSGKVITVNENTIVIPPRIKTMKIKIKKNKKGRYFVSLVFPNGKIFMHSEDYANLENAQKSVDSFLNQKLSRQDIVIER